LLQFLTRETGQRGLARAVDDLAAGVQRQPFELLAPVRDPAGVPQPLRMRAVPVRAPFLGLAIVAQQQDLIRLQPQGSRRRAGAAVAVGIEWSVQQGDAVLGRVAVAADGLALKRRTHLRNVLCPPRRIECEQVIGPEA
jgi:hypothetical protein